MKFLMVILVILIPQVAMARVGETKEQCKKRYGKPFAKTDRGAIVYLANGVVLEVFYEGSVAQMILYKMKDKGPLGDDVVDAIIRNYSADWELTEPDKLTREWFLPGKLVAIHGRNDKMLMVCNMSYLNKSYVEEKTKGF